MMTTEDEILAAIDEIISGRRVKRSVHELIYEGRDLTGIFISRLKMAGFIEITVGATEVAFEERFAAFAIKNHRAYFGWVFNERFTEKKSRKLFGSELRNGKGDWAIQITANNPQRIFVRRAERFGMESDGNFVIE